MNTNVTPSIEAGGQRKETKDRLRNVWRKQVESEERLKFLKRMVGVNIGVRETEHIGENIVEKFRSEKMKRGESEQEIVKLIMNMKLKDEKCHQRELKREKQSIRSELEGEFEGKNSFRRIISDLNYEAKRWRKMERNRFQKKEKHLKGVREKIELEEMEKCPEEIETYKELSIFSKKKMENLEKDEVEITVIGEVALDEDEKSILKLPPKFAVRRRLRSVDMECDTEMGLAKTRYQIHKENGVRGLEQEEKNEKDTMKRRKLLDNDELEELEVTEKLYAEGRRIYDPLTKS